MFLETNANIVSICFVLAVGPFETFRENGTKIITDWSKNGPESPECSKNGSKWFQKWHVPVP